MPATSGPVFFLDDADGGLVRQREMALGDDLVANLHGDFIGDRVGKNLGVDPVVASALDIHPVSSTIVDDEDEGAPVALDDRFLRHETALRETLRLESDVDGHPGP